MATFYLRTRSACACAQVKSRHFVSFHSGCSLTSMKKNGTWQVLNSICGFDFKGVKGAPLRRTFARRETCIAHN